MKFLNFALLAFILTIFSGGAMADSFTITSASFTNGGKLPNEQVLNRFGCTGGNISPQLSWADAPKETVSFALVAHDPDAPKANGWYHWIILNIPSDVTSLKAGQQINHPMLQFRNDFGGVTYGGACPPKGHGIHHYNFTVYALPVKLLPSPNTTPEAIVRQIKGKALASATITATYERK